jgi:hypothetical protein
MADVFPGITMRFAHEFGADNGNVRFFRHIRASVKIAESPVTLATLLLKGPAKMPVLLHEALFINAVDKIVGNCGQALSDNPPDRRHMDDRNNLLKDQCSGSLDIIPNGPV